MIGDFKRYDMTRRPNRQWHILRPITWLLSYPDCIMHKARINKDGIPADLKPPYFLLCNHNSFLDFKVMTKAVFPHRANYVVAIDGFLGRGWLLRAVGCICNRKFVRSFNLVINMMKAKDNGDIVALFPEARYSLCGTTAIIPPSLGKMVKKMNIPLVVLLMHGHHINSPFWNTGNRKVKPVESEMKLICTVSDVQKLSVEEINEKITLAFQYDEYAWQKERGIRIKSKKRAEGLHKVLYQCPACKAEYRMSSCGILLRCDACGKEWEMSELGELSALSGDTEFSHIPDWYEWERGNVREEVAEGKYSWTCEKVRVESLPNDKKFIVFPNRAKLTHGMDGFSLSGSYNGEDYDIHWPVAGMHACHIEYDYFGRGDCVDLNTNDDTFYLFPEEGDFAVTKISLAAEELYKKRTV
ncbi:MAG: 1-acyl-sn-glycerol-3-phosphate acyltransferase [Oscillospiraceae bacterium]|nr:1-acyl-sn-glycerol-3-phosphate acyltransferase [Oscillospiraceae bacterium]